MVVAGKHIGTAADRHDMEKLQLKQVLRRNFGRLALFGFASTVICTWEIVLSSLSLSLLNGGTAGLFWNYIIVCLGFSTVYASLAELGSIMPTSGGQYYWVSVLAPPKLQKYLSYVTGWLCTTAWNTGIASAAFLAGTIIQGLLVLNVKDYVAKQWHGTLLIIAISMVGFLFNTVLAAKLPLIEGILVILHLLGILVVVPLLVLLPTRSGGSVFVDYYNGGEWKTNGVSAMVGMLPVFSSLLGLDCTIHMAEETVDSSRALPTSLLLGFGVNALLGFIVVLTAIYTAEPISHFLASQTGYPFIDMFYRATGLAATNVLTAIIVLNLTSCTIAALATASRQLWAFSRNRGVPFSSTLAPDVLPHDVPIKALMVSMAITICLSFINIGSTAALSAIFSVSNGSLVSSYIVTISCMIWRRFHSPLPPARFSLGKYGLFLNIVSICFLLPIFVFSFFPSTSRPTLASMNWGVVIYCSVIIFSTLHYHFGGGRQSYQPPNENIKEAIEAGDQFYANSEERGMGDTGARLIGHYLDQKQR